MIEKRTAIIDAVHYTIEGDEDRPEVIHFQPGYHASAWLHKEESIIELMNFLAQALCDLRDERNRGVG